MTTPAKKPAPRTRKPKPAVQSPDGPDLADLKPSAPWDRSQMRVITITCDGSKPPRIDISGFHPSEAWGILTDARERLQDLIPRFEVVSDGEILNEAE